MRKEVIIIQMACDVCFRDCDVIDSIPFEGKDICNDCLRTLLANAGPVALPEPEKEAPQPTEEEEPKKSRKKKEKAVEAPSEFAVTLDNIAQLGFDMRLPDQADQAERIFAALGETTTFPSKEWAQDRIDTMKADHKITYNHALKHHKEQLATLIQSQGIDVGTEEGRQKAVMIRDKLTIAGTTLDMLGDAIIEIIHDDVGF
jgi:hypothetical protein